MLTRKKMKTLKPNKKKEVLSRHADLGGEGDVDNISLLARLHFEEQMAQEHAIVSDIMSKYVTNKTALSALVHDPLTNEVMTFKRLTEDLDSSLRKRLYAHIQISTPPTDDDWPTWEVPVPSGREESTVCDLLLIADYGGVHRRSTPPRSAYAAPGITGRIYIEAQTRNDVITLFKPIRGIRWWETKVVTRADAMKLLNRRPIIYTPRVNTWVRLKIWPFKTDLAFIQEVLQQDKLRVSVLPRPWYHKPPEFRLPRRRPLAKPFDKNKAIQISGPSSVAILGVGLATKYHYFDIRYNYYPPRDSYTSYDSSGFQDLVVNSSEYFAIDVYPSISEITPFMACASISHSVKLLHVRLADNRRLKNGDRVLITSAPCNFNSIYERHVGRTGIFDGATNTFGYVHFFDVNSGLSETVQIPLNSIRRHYKIGDFVRAYAGSHQERDGWVTNINESEDRITIYNAQSPDNHLEVLVSLTEFAETECRIGQNPHRDVIDMSYFELSVYENLPVTVVKGPLKVNQLQDLDLGDLAFELDVHKWYRLYVRPTGNDDQNLVVKLESVYAIPATCSMLATFTEDKKPSTPEPESIPPTQEGLWSPNCLNPSVPGVLNGVIPETCWLMKLPHIDTFRTLKLSIQSFGMYESGKWDKRIGFYKGLIGSQVKFFSQDTGFLMVPFYYVNPVHPTKAPQNAHCLAEGADLGKRFRIYKFGDEECEVVPFHGGRSGNTRRIATCNLAVIG
ncbi:hypothetical protein NP233_g7438 [Leucocoprinus birnbaumii]|uniref:NGN domain-containing protein n=1 Tax=Leucocoprinus birnbaumii TaxID=56174 RepID=A0AAD5VP76_9AGAR|nr:hypothetical protein NP233_g7438 [Leucocoprinus birnbaumii]